MTEEEFRRQFEALTRKIKAEPESRRHLYQQDLHRMVERALGAGIVLPEAVRQLDEQLTEAAIEAQFDNLPV